MRDNDNEILARQVAEVTDWLRLQNRLTYDEWLEFLSVENARTKIVERANHNEAGHEVERGTVSVP